MIPVDALPCVAETSDCAMQPTLSGIRVTQAEAEIACADDWMQAAMC